MNVKKLSRAAMSYPAPHRCFSNPLPDFNNDTHHASSSSASSQIPQADDSLHLLLRSSPSILSHKFLYAAVALKDEVVRATWSDPSAKLNKNLDMYKGTLGTAFLCFKAYQTTGNLEDLHLCRDIIQACSAASASMRQLRIMIPMSSQTAISISS